MAALRKRDMLAGTEGGVMGGVAVVRGHGVPEVAPRGGEHAAGRLAADGWGIGPRGKYLGFSAMAGSCLSERLARRERVSAFNASSYGADTRERGRALACKVLVWW